MAVSVTVLVASKQVEAVQTTQYTPVNVKAIIDKATVTNTTATAATFSANLVNVSGTPGASNLIISARIIGAGECYTCPELVGQVLAPGQSLSAVAGTASALTLRVSGREVT